MLERDIGSDVTSPNGDAGPAHRRGRPARPLAASTPPLQLETLATAGAEAGHRVLAALICALAVLGSALLLPIVNTPMPAIPAFLGVNQSVLFFVYALTTWLFFSQFRRTRAPSLLVLGAGSLYTTAVVLLQLICFPDLLRPGLIMGRGAPTLTWLWSFWHLAPPLFAVPYAIMEGDGRKRQTRPNAVAWTMWATVAAVLLAAGLTGLLCVRFVEVLPVTVDPDGGYWALTRSGIGPILIVLTALALAVLCWTTRLRRVLQLWLAVSLLLLLLDNVITDLGAARVTMGWFVGRVEALLAALVVLGIYLWELDALYRRAEVSALAREQARAEAQSARENLEIALEASGMGDWELDLVRDTSRRTLRHDRIFGYDRVQDEWGWARFMEHVPPEDQQAAQAAFASALQQGRLELECRIVPADRDTIRWISVQGRTYYDEAGRPVSLAGCVADVTARRQTDLRLQQAERMEAIGQLTGGVAHDFNNLLTVILGNLEMITRRPEDSARVERLARVAFVAGRRGTDLTEKLLAFSRRQVVKPETLNLNRLACEFQPLLAQAVGEAVEIEFDLDPQLDPVRIDPSQLQAALLNLAGNARDAMPSGGRLRLETRNVVLGPRDAAELAELKPGRYLRIALEDTGTGMDAATATRAFEPFFTTKEVGKGTGLGLSQVYGFARQAGGSARIRAGLGQGCTVELYLPPSAEAPTRAIAAPEPPGPLRPAVNGEVVLIVEDEEAVREMAAESLDALGYGVLTAQDARVALDILRGPSRVDILFSDVVMPGGMNGAQLAVEARTIRPAMKVLLTSGYTTTATGGARELPAGVPFLRKPYLRDDLAEQLRLALAG